MKSSTSDIAYSNCSLMRSNMHTYKNLNRLIGYLIRDKEVKSVTFSKFFRVLAFCDQYLDDDSDTLYTDVLRIYYYASINVEVEADASRNLANFKQIFEKLV